MEFPVDAFAISLENEWENFFGNNFFLSKDKQFLGKTVCGGGEGDNDDGLKVSRIGVSMWVAFVLYYYYVWLMMQATKRFAKMVGMTPRHVFKRFAIPQFEQIKEMRLIWSECRRDAGECIICVRFIVDTAVA